MRRLNENSNIGRGAHYASPRAASRGRFQPNENQPKGALISNYYDTTDNDLVEDPYRKPHMEPPSDMIQEFLNRMPAKTSTQIPDTMEAMEKKKPERYLRGTVKSGYNDSAD